MKNPNFACCWSYEQATLNIRVNNLTNMSQQNASVQKKTVSDSDQTKFGQLIIRTLISNIPTFLAKFFLKRLVCSVWMLKLIWRPKIISIPRTLLIKIWSQSTEVNWGQLRRGILNLEGSWTNHETKFIYNCYEHSSSISFWIWKFEEI